MNKKSIIIKILLVLTLANVCLVDAQQVSGVGATSAAQQKINSFRSASAGGLNLSKSLGFQENKGQIADANGVPASFVLFKAEAPGLNIWITTTGLTYQFLKSEEEDDKRGAANEIEEPHAEKMNWRRVDMVLKNASIKSENIIKEGDISQGEVSYYFGHCPDGIFNVKTFTKITVKNIYKDIDWVIYTSNAGGIKHDFIVYPGADPNQIKLIYEGGGTFQAKSNRINFENEFGQLTEGKLLCYQDNETNVIQSNYVLKENKKFNFSGAGISKNKESRNSSVEYATQKGENFSFELALHLENYNQSKTLVIDPQLVWSTIMVGGNGADGTMAVDCDLNGNVFVTGYTDGSVFPNIDPGAGTYYQGVSGGGNEGFIIKFNSVGAKIWSTFYGGSGIDWPHAIICDPTGNIFITGHTQSSDFPTYNNPAAAYAGAYYQGVLGVNTDAFILKFSNSGIRLFATYYGGAASFTSDQGRGITCDALGNVYVTGSTSATDFPVASAYQPAKSGGLDVFVLKFSNTMQRQWATFYGGDGSDEGFSVACDPVGNVLITGYKAFGTPTGFPVLSPGGGAYVQGTGTGYDDAIILKFNSAGTLIWSTLYGGSGADQGHGIVCDATGNVFVCGMARSADLPTLDPGNGAYYQGSFGGGAGGINSLDGDAFMLKFSNTGVLLWGTYYGGNGKEYKAFMNDVDNIAIDECGNVYISFETTSNDLTTQGGCGKYLDATYTPTGEDLFIVKFNNNGIRLWASYFGGNSNDQRKCLAVDLNNNLYLSGEWRAFSFDGSTYPFVNPGGGAYYTTTHLGGDESFIAKFTPIAPPTFSQSQVNSTSCPTCNGSATITVNCGDPNYSYTWSNGSSTTNVSSNTNTISGLCPGNYTVTATSNCNHTQTASFVITGTTCGVITANVNSATMCSGVTPCPTLTATGASGTTPYTYTWNTGETTQNINPCPLTTTTYTVTIKDNTGASATSVATVTVNPVVTVTLSTVAITCSGAATGSVTATGSGGTSPYTFSWSTGATGISTSSMSVVSLAAGTYTVTITDSKGCVATSTTVLVSPPPLLGQFTKGTANCSNCGCQEWLMVNATGGTMPYTYLWTDGHDKRYKNKICPGNYLIKVTDKNGCSVDVSITAP